MTLVISVMPTNTRFHDDDSVSARPIFGREVLGIAEGVLGLLLMLALVSAAQDARWIGVFGDWAARGLNFTLGQYAAFLLPAMLFIAAWSSLAGAAPLLTRFRSSLRTIGGFLLLVSGCALLTLHSGDRKSLDPERAFEAGGLIGSFLIDSEGLNLTRHLGRAGAFVVFYGLAAAGFVLFTEILLRDVGRAALHITGWLLPGRWVNAAKAMGARLEEALGIFSFLSFGWLRQFLRRIAFRADRPGRILTVGPIREIRLAGGPALGSYDADEPEERAPRRRRMKLPTPPEEREEPAIPLQRAALSPREEAPAPLLRAPQPAQPELDLFPTKYELPSLDLLADPPATNYRMSESEAEELSRRIEETLAQFKIEVQVTEVVQGPVVTRFSMRVAPGIKVNKILALENDIAMSLRAQQVRILAPIPGEAAVGIEVPNKKTNPVFLREMMASDELARHKSPLAFALGKNIAGEPVIADLAQMPHVLIAGATGSGKSVCLNCIIASFLFRNPPDRMKMIMIDPKRVELSVYQAIPHLLTPVVCDPRKAAAALAWTVEQMESRYKLLAEVGVRNIEGYNAIVADKKPNKKAFGRELKFMPQIVVVIDELADLMMVAKNEVEEYIIRLAQMARAVGIHLILATQRPSVNVITGIIKANFPTRIAFRVSSKVDSRTILDLNGAQALLGRGDMLYSPGGVKPYRIQGAFVSDAEIESLADSVRAQEAARYEKEDFEAAPTAAQRAKAQLMQSAIGGRGMDAGGEDGYGDDEDADGGFALRGMPTAGRVDAAPLPPADMENLSDDDLYDIALRLVLESRKASVSYIQRRLKIGYARAGRVMDMMEERGIVGPYQGSKPRDLLVNAAELLRRLEDSEN